MGVLSEAVPGLNSLPGPAPEPWLPSLPGPSPLMRCRGYADRVWTRLDTPLLSCSKERCLHPFHRHLNMPLLRAPPLLSCFSRRLFTPLHCYLNTPLLCAPFHRRLNTPLLRAPPLVSCSSRRLFTPPTFSPEHASALGICLCQEPEESH